MAVMYDVVVIGAGPAGSAAAKKCVDGGLKTLLIEKHKLPRRKNCSGIIMNVAQNYILENFGPIPENTFGKPYAFRGVGFYFPSVGMIHVENDCYNLYIWRDKFDHWMAKTSGAVLQDQSRFLHAEDKGSEVEVTIEKGGKNQKIKCKYLIAADGSNSHVVRDMAPEAYDGIPWVFACQKYFEGTIDADERYLHWFVTLGMGPFPWLNLKDDQIIIGQALMLGEKFEPNFLKLIDFLKTNFNLKIKKEIATEGCIANMMGPLNRFFPGRGRLLVAGDASGLTHQGGEGISCAVFSGGYSGEAVIEAIKTGEDALPIYKRLVRPEMEITLDQVNFFRWTKTAASDASRQPPVFHNLSYKQKLLATRDFIKFIKSEMFAIEGFGKTVMKNMLRRQILGNYHIPAADE